VHGVVELLLNERRKTEPDPVAAVEKAAAEPGAEGAVEGEAEGEIGDGVGSAAPRRVRTSGPLSGVEEAYARVVESAEFLFAREATSPVPYLVCAGLRLGETRMQGQMPAPGFALGRARRFGSRCARWPAGEHGRKLLRATLPIWQPSAQGVA